jgi:hypothetical protein
LRISINRDSVNAEHSSRSQPIDDDVIQNRSLPNIAFAQKAEPSGVARCDSDQFDFTAGAELVVQMDCTELTFRLDFKQ